MCYGSTRPTGPGVLSRFSSLSNEVFPDVDVSHGHGHVNLSVLIDGRFIVSTPLTV